MANSTFSKYCDNMQKLKEARALGRRLRINRAHRELLADPIYNAAFNERRRNNRKAKTSLLKIL